MLSERLITLDGSPFSTLREFAENTKIEDEIGNWDRTIPERMENCSRLPLLSRPLRKRIRTFGEEGDDCTKTFSSQTKQTSKKIFGYLQAKLGKAPGIDA